MCKMAVLGRGSVRDRKKEEELRLSGDPRYTHLFEDLHVEISTFAAPAEAHARIAYALAEVRRFLVPVSIGCFFYTYIQNRYQITNLFLQRCTRVQPFNRSPITTNAIPTSTPIQLTVQFSRLHKQNECDAFWHVPDLTRRGARINQLCGSAIYI